MRIATWNVNTLRARQDNILSWLDSAKPDVVCLQEIKCQDAEFPLLELRAAVYLISGRRRRSDTERRHFLHHSSVPIAHRMEHARRKSFSRKSFSRCRELGRGRCILTGRFRGYFSG